MEVRTLEQWRAVRDLTLKSLAQKAGVSEFTILRIGQGKTKPYPRTAYKIAQALGVGPEQVKEFQPEYEPPKNKPGAAGSDYAVA
jgi:DNA-binding XRE family transcriptional regulator